MNANVPPAPPPAPIPNGSNTPYDFIMDTGKPKRFSGSLKQRVTIVSIGAVLFLVIAIVFISIIGSGGKTNIQSLVNLAQQQNELVRIATIGTTDAVSRDTKVLAETTKLSIQSNQNQTLALLSQYHHNVSIPTLLLLKNSRTDQELTSAAQSDTFDDTFTKIIQDQLNTYKQSLQSEFKLATRNSEKTVLKTNFNNVVIIQGPQKT